MQLKTRWLNQTNWPVKLTWLQNSATQQGLAFILVSLASLVLMATISLAYVDYELKQQNRDIVAQTRELVGKGSPKIDDDPIDDDDILTIMTSGFVLSGVLVAAFTIIMVVAMSRASSRRIKRMEQVLAEVAEGNLNARTGEKLKHNDLARIAVAMDEMLSRLQGSVAAMTDISVNIAHELKTPITRLQHNLQALQDEAAREGAFKSEAFNEELQQALNDSSRLAAIFDALLRISQIESGARRSRFAPTDITAVVATVADIYTAVAEDANMQLSVSAPSSPLLLQGDRELLTQLLANLVENALRYCPPGSRICLSCHTQGEMLCLQVSDNGPGIADTEKDRVFERLYRVDKSRSDGGIGLGLALVKAIVGLHHGQITLSDNHPGLKVQILLARGL